MVIRQRIPSCRTDVQNGQMESVVQPVLMTSSARDEPGEASVPLGLMNCREVKIRPGERTGQRS